MDMGKIIEDSFKYPVSNWRRLLIFGVIVLIYQFSFEIITVYSRFSFIVLLLIIPSIITYLLIVGYQIRAMGTSIRGKMELPEFNNWFKMLIDGLGVIIVEIIYVFIPIIVLLVGFGVISYTRSSGSVVLGVIITLIGVVLLFITALILTMGILNIAYHGEVGAGLRLREILAKIKKIGWLSYLGMLIVLVLLGFIIAAVAGLLTLIPFVGVIIASLIVYPYLYLFLVRALSLIYKETLEDEPETSSEVENFPGTETNPD